MHYDDGASLGADRRLDVFRISRQVVDACDVAKDRSRAGVADGVRGRNEVE